ncbi:unnamed protein product [Calypogeia fissa]
MAEVVALPTVLIPTRAWVSRGSALSSPGGIPIRFSALNFTNLKNKLNSAPKPTPKPQLRFNGLAAVRPCMRTQDTRGGDAVTPIASSSRDAGAWNGGEDNDNENRSWWSPRDGFGLYPWDPSWQAMDFDDIPWIQDETITLFTSEGVVKLRNSRVVNPRASYNERKHANSRDLNRLKRYREEDYMDPKQGLCLGAIFDIAATNGVDMGRRFCVFGFCRSIEMLSDVVEDTILERGGEVLIADKGSTTGLHEKLTMTVAMPALWGVPPAFDVLKKAIRSGGGIVEKTYKKWEFF